MTYTVARLEAYKPFQVRSGVTYTADSTGTVTSVPAGSDLHDLLDQGGYLVDSSLTPAVNGLYTTRIPLTNGRNADGTGLGAGAAGKFAITNTAGTSGPLLTSEAANSNTKTDTVIFEHVLPRNYIATKNITVTANAFYTLGSGTVGTKTLTAAAYKCTDAGLQGSTIIATAAATLIATTATDHAFVITGTTLSPGDRIEITLVLVIQDSGGSNITATLNSVRLS